MRRALHQIAFWGGFALLIPGFVLALIAWCICELYFTLCVAYEDKFKPRPLYQEDHRDDDYMQ